jgi:hypothetical protein
VSAKYDRNARRSGYHHDGTVNPNVAEKERGRERRWSPTPGFLKGMAWVLDPPDPLHFSDGTRPGREGLSLILDSDGTRQKLALSGTDSLAVTKAR